MTNQKKTAPAAKPTKPTNAPKPPKKLIPRPAPKLEVPVEIESEEAQPVSVPEVASGEAPVLATAAATAPAHVRAPRKPTREDETVAKHQKVLAEALEMALAIKYDQPKVMRQAPAKGKKAAKPEKPAKVKKVKLVRDSFAMPEHEYARIAELKKRLTDMGSAVKKSELLRGGVAVLAALNDAELMAVMAHVERIKTGRPTK